MYPDCYHPQFYKYESEMGSKWFDSLRQPPWNAYTLCFANVFNR